MKKLFIVLLGLAAIGCNREKEVPQLTGAYSQLSATLKGNGIDTTTVDKQLKIYTSNYMMYAFFSEDDSVSAFGIGTYSAEPGLIKENIFFTADDSTFNFTLRDYTLEIENTDTGFKQVIQEIGDSLKYQLTEVYERTGTAQTTPLDGAWQLASFTSITSGDTIKRDITAYKVYYAGNFMFGNSYHDSTKFHHTGIGYGTFEYVNDTQIKESVKVSTYKTLTGKTFNISIARNGPNQFTQTLTFENGQQDIEVYKRMK